MIRYKPSLSARLSQAGFSLVEMLVVIAIISVLMTVGAIGIGNMTGGKGVSSGVSSAEAIFDEARTTAISRTTKARVLISIDKPEKPESYLRRLLVAYEETNEDTGEPTGKWTLTSRATTLPDQTYYSLNYSRKKNESGGMSEIDKVSLTDVKSEFRGEYAYYEFNSQGISTGPGSTFIIGSGARPVSAPRPRVTAAAKRDFGGFVVWRNGRTSVFRGPDQMELPETVTEF